VLGCLYMRWLTRLRPDGSDPDSVDRVALHQLFRVWAALASDGAVTSPVLVGQGDQLARDPIVVTEQLAPGAPRLPGSGRAGVGFPKHPHEQLPSCRPLHAGGVVEAATEFLGGYPHDPHLGSDR